MAGVDGHPGGVLGHPPDPVDVAEVEGGVDALGEQVHGQGDHVDVAGPLAVAEQRPLHPVGAGQHGQLGRGHRRAPVVVGMEAQDDRVAVVDRAAEPLDDVGVHVGPVHLHRIGQVDDDRAFGGGLDDRHHRLADLDGEVGLGTGEALGGVLVADIGPGQLRLELLAEPGGGDGDVDDPGPVEAEDHPALQLRGRVVEVDDGPRRAGQRLEGALDQLLPALDQHLDGDVVGYQALLDDLALEVVVGLRGGGEPDLDLLEADLDQGVEQLQLALGIHGIDQGLVPVPQVDAGPARRPVALAIRPGPVGQDEGPVGAVEVERHRGDVARHVQPAGRSHRRRCRWSVSSDRWSLLALPGCLVMVRSVVVCVSCVPDATKNPLAEMAQEVAGERDVTFAVR